MRNHDDLDLEVDLEERSPAGPFFLGLLLGAGAALLLAPGSGAETRAALGRLLGAGAGGAGGPGGSARVSAGGWVERARGAVEDQVDRVREAMDEGRAAARDAAGELRHTIDEAKAAYRAGVAGTPPPPMPRRVAAPAPENGAAAAAEGDGAAG